MPQLPLFDVTMIKKLTIKSRLILVIVLLGLELIVGAAVGLISLGHANEQLRSLYDDRLVCLGQLDTHRQYYSRLELQGKHLEVRRTDTPIGITPVQYYTHSSQTTG